MDTGCNIILIGKKLLSKILPNIKPKVLPLSIPVREVNDARYLSSEYLQLTLIINSKLSNKQPAVAKFNIEVHVVNKLYANLLIGNNVIKLQEILLDFRHNQLLIDIYSDIVVSIIAVAKAFSSVRRTVRAKSQILISPCETTQIPVQYTKPLPSDKDFLFKPSYRNDLEEDERVFAYVVDFDLFFVLAKNNISNKITIPRRASLGSIVKYTQNGYYIVDPSCCLLAICK